MGKRIHPLPTPGDYVGLWLVLEIGSKQCLCRCFCGIEKLVSTDNLVRNLTKGCISCRNKTVVHLTVPQLRKLRAAVWSALGRCSNENHSRYGGRGIKVHEPWIENPTLFVEYLATLDGFDDPDLMIDRIDNDGHYEPGNLRWVTPSVSATNRHSRWEQ